VRQNLHLKSLKIEEKSVEKTGKYFIEHLNTQIYVHISNNMKSSACTQEYVLLRNNIKKTTSYQFVEDTNSFGKISVT